jgi:phage terminase large subunit-like protein
MPKSLAMLIAEMSAEEREAALDGIDPEDLIWDWKFWGRPEQQFPDDDSWDVGLFMAGRGAGKTRSAAEWVREKARITGQGHIRFLLVARTAADVREVMIEGDSGIMAVSPPSEQPNYEPSKRRLTWPNGNTAFCTTADEPDSLRGVQSHYSWGDEMAAWRELPDKPGEAELLTAWDHLRIATRLGNNPQLVATTTPKRTPILRKLLAEEAGVVAREGVPGKEPNERIFVTRGTTMDNAGNLAGSYLEAITGVYAGTRLARQELYGEMLDQAEGALWTDAMLDKTREYVSPQSVPLRIIGVDPTVAERPGDMCGIVVVSSTAEHDLYKRHAWVLEDATMQGAPNEWAEAVVHMARKWGCPVVAEVNQGGALVANAIHQIDPTVKVLEVHSKVGKQLRAEPVTLAYEQGRVHHVGTMPDLETDMLTWVPGVGRSPDRIDALVHALTALLIKPPKGFSGGAIQARSQGGRQMNLGRQQRNRPIQGGAFRAR